MTVIEVNRRLRAWETGAPLRRYQTLHHAVVEPDDALVVAFVRMAGESRPWGIAWGRPDGEATVMSVPDGRVRDDVARICADFGADLLAHLRVHNWTYDPLPKDAEVGDLRQVWVPNGQHVAMFHQLAYAYAQTKFGGADVETLNSLGRLAGWLFRESTRRGHQHMIDASQSLRDAYVFPAQDARQAHLGYLLAWLSTSGDRDARSAAAELAERQPVSPTMDPRLERDSLQKPIERRRELLEEGSDAQAEDESIEATLRGELERRWSLCAAAYEAQRHSELPVNPGVAALIRDSLDEFYWQCQASELKISDPSGRGAFIPHPETDFHGSSAASRYLIYAASDERYVNTLIHHDDELFEEALADGRALCAVVTEVRDDGDGRSTVPVWLVEIEGDKLHRIREGGRVVPRGSRKHWASVVRMDRSGGSVTAELVWQGNKTKPIPLGLEAKPADDAWLGRAVSFVASDAADLTRRRSHRVWKAKDGPGGWLTHGSRPAPILADIANDEPEAIIDDVAQIEGEDL